MPKAEPTKLPSIPEEEPPKPHDSFPSLADYPRVGLDTFWYTSLNLSHYDDLEIKQIRYELDWSRVQPHATSTPDWTGPDGEIAAIRNLGIMPAVLIESCPYWACPTRIGNPGGTGPITDTMLPDFVNFMQAAAARYSARNDVHYWELFNEPDSRGTWARDVGTPVGHGTPTPTPAPRLYTVPTYQAPDLAQVLDMYGTPIIQITTPSPVVQVWVGSEPLYFDWRVRFDDVHRYSWEYRWVECLASNGVVSGYVDGSFRPNGDVTRGQLTKIVKEGLGISTIISGTQRFQDVPISHTYYTHTETLFNRGAITGYPCGGAGEPCVPPDNRPYFRPQVTTTRAQISKVVSLAANYTDPPGTQRFQDVSPGSPFYDYIQRLANRNYITGYACGRGGEPCIPPNNLPYFRPGANSTCGQVSKVVGQATTAFSCPPTP